MKQNKAHEFSKTVLAVCVGAYIASVIAGICVAFHDNEHIGELFELIKMPTSVAIGFYAWKARSENIVKYSKDQIDKLNHADNSKMEEY